MTRIDREHWNAATFPIILEIPTRYDDLDGQGHVNNASATVILQEARVRLNIAAKLPSLLGDLRVLVGAINVEYAAELYHPAPVMAYTGILAIGRTSFTIAQVLRQNGRSAIYAQTVMVITGAQGPTPIPDDLRTAYAGLRLG